MKLTSKREKRPTFSVKRVSDGQSLTSYVQSKEYVFNTHTLWYNFNIAQSLKYSSHAILVEEPYDILCTAM